MLSIVIPTLNAERHLPRTLAALVGPTVRGLVSEVILADGGSTDGTAAIADETGARFVATPRGRGSQLAAGAREARGAWLLFLHADTVLEPAWGDEVESFIGRVERVGMGEEERAGVFRFALDDFTAQARRMESLVRWRCSLFALPYGDQGLVISRRFYDRLGGYADVPLMEDVDLVRRIGRRRLVYFRTAAVTSAERYRKDGYVLRPARNLACLALYLAGVPPRFIARLYG